MRVLAFLFLVSAGLCTVRNLSAIDVTTGDLGLSAGGNVPQTRVLQDAIDRIAREGGGRLVIEAGTYLTGALHFKPGVSLRLERGAVLKGSDSIADYPLEMTRIRGVTMKYFPALINAVGCDHFQVTGEGELNGNGFRYWREAWLRQQWNPGAPGLDSQRPRLLYVAKSRDVLVQGVTLRNSGYWTSHYYDCRDVKVIGVTCKSEVAPDDYMGNSPDGMDFDGVDGLLVKGCVVDCNDDGIVFKGGMGPWADDPVKSPDVRINRNVVIEDTHFGAQCHACIGFGSECHVASNVVVRRCTSAGAAWSFVRFKVRPDTPQVYSDMTFEDLEGGVNALVRIDTFPRKHHFYNFGDRENIPPTVLRNIRVRNVRTHFLTREYKWIDPAYPESLDMQPILYENVTADELPGKWWTYRPHRPYPWPECEYSAAVTNGPRLRGFMSPSRKMREEDFEEMSRMGVTLLRYQMIRGWGKLHVNSDLDDFNAWLDGKLDHLETVVLPAAEKYGFKVVIDLHSPPGGRNRGKEMEMFFDTRCASAFKEAWLKIARRFKGNPFLYAYDLVNEPKQVRPTSPGMGCLELQYEVAKAIRTVDPVTPISVESNFNCNLDTFGFMEPLPLKDIIYQVHFYRPMKYTHQGIGSNKNVSGLKYPDTSRGWTKECLRARLSTVREFQRRFGAKIYVGEFSVCAWAEGGERYLEDCISLFEEYGWDWTYHAFREADCWSVEHQGISMGTLVPVSTTSRKEVLERALKSAGDASVPKKR